MTSTTPRKRTVNGYPLYCVTTDRFKTNILTVSFTFPGDYDLSPARSLLFGVLKHGSARYPSQRLINLRLEELCDTDLSVRNEIYGPWQGLSVCAEFLDAAFAPPKTDLVRSVLELIAGLLYGPVLGADGNLDAGFVGREREILLDALDTEQKSPRSYAARRCRELLCRRDGYDVSALGNETALKRHDGPFLTDLWRRELCLASPSFFYVGSADPADVAEKIGSVFAPIAAKRDTLEMPPYKLPKEIGTCTEERNVKQSVLALGFRSPRTIKDPEIFALMLANELLGVCPSSRLFMNVREKYGNCYDCTSYLDLYAGVLAVMAGTGAGSVRKVRHAIESEVKSLAKGDFSQTELEDARTSLLSAYLQIGDEPASIEAYWNGRIRTGVLTTVRQTASGIRAVRREDVVRAFAELVPGACCQILGREDSDET